MNKKRFNDSRLPYVVIEPDEFNPDNEYPIFVMMHGYGSHMDDLVPLAEVIDRDKYLYVFPNAPIKLEMGFGMSGYAWSNPPDSEFDANGFSEGLVEELLIEIGQQYKISDGNNFIGGFSQGGMMAYRYGLRRPQQFSGVVALSSRLTESDIPLDNAENKEILPRVFISHGTTDTIIPIHAGRQSHDILKKNGYQSEYREYSMDHQITEYVLNDLKDWLQIPI
tara:strand:- start:75 stop:743 length:669 start_codon:yes stop_codon:yes gene_type:complete